MVNGLYDATSGRVVIVRGRRVQPSHVSSHIMSNPRSLLRHTMQLIPGLRPVNRVKAQPVDASMLCVPIETPAGGCVTDFRSVSEWDPASRAAIRRNHSNADCRPVLLGEFLDEEHHRIYPQPWIIGRFRAEFLLSQELAPTHRVLDLGCGAGRVGVWIIQALDAGRYCGIDRHLRSLLAFAAYEMRLFGLAAKKPRLLLDAEFRFEHFQQKFDAVTDIWVTRHMTDERFHQAYASLRTVLVPGGRVFVSGLLPERLGVIQSLGYCLLCEQCIDYPLHVGQDRHEHGDYWHIFGLGAEH